MKAKVINKLVESLYSEMLGWWEKNKKAQGFEEAHEQGLYDALCKYRDAEKTWEVH